MFIEPVSTEIVQYISSENHHQVLKEHFNLFFRLLAENKLTADATFETVDGIQRCLSGIPYPFNNALFGAPERGHWDTCIRKQIAYFKEAKVPFVWFLDEESSLEFKKRLLDCGFQDGGIFRGVVGVLGRPIPVPEIADDCVLELVQDESAMDEFNELVCSTFGIQGISKEYYRQVAWNAMKNTRYPMFHWIARKQGRVVSAVSTFVEGDVVSFWNEATLPQMRRQGLSTALCSLALNDAISKGCRIGASYLMADGMALGICTKLGYQTKWRFNVFLSPDTPN